MISKTEITKAVSEIKNAKTPLQLEILRRKYLGRKGIITRELRKISELSPNQRVNAGKAANEAKKTLEALISSRLESLIKGETAAASQQLDVTAPVSKLRYGYHHPVKEIEKELIQAFWQIGFKSVEGPEIESDWYNFEALNIPVDHPARDMQDTFYLSRGGIPRTHTSSVQIRYMEKHALDDKGPIRIISPGKVYRNEDEDPTHIWAFHQLEGLVIDKGITLADLKGTLNYMMRALLGEQAEVKLLPSYFPYTEPSLEVHARANKDSEWLEMAGAGMVHPQVLANVGIDAAEYSGFAFGAGLERLAAIRHGVDDIRYFWRPDLRFIKQF